MTRSPRAEGDRLRRPLAPAAAEVGGLRQRVLRGGVYLVVREGLGVVVGVVGAVALTRTIGPANFGVYVALVALFIYLQSLATLGLNAFLVRSEGDLQHESLDEAFTMLVALSVLVLVAAELSFPLIIGFTHLDGLRLLGPLTLLALPVVVLSQVPLAKLEHDLNFRVVALMEGSAQVLLYAVALPLATLGWGASAGVVGWLGQQAVLVCWRFCAARYRPSLRWSAATGVRMVRYGFSYSTSLWVWQLRSLVNPIIVSRYGGASAVGMVGLAIRLVENLGFVKIATWRISIAALGKVQRDRAKLVSAVQDGMALQQLALGPLLVVFACLGKLVIPMVFGDEWTPVLSVFPFIALGYLVNATFNLHSSALYVLRRNSSVTAFHLVHVLVFASAAALLVPDIGVRGYGIAELAVLPSYCLIHLALARFVGQPHYVLASVWLTGFGVALFVQDLGGWALSGLVLIAVWPGTRSEIQRFVAMLRGVA
jgi:O-antigen/teichoic acid export membrane protein